MALRLTKLQKRLCNLLQDGLPICSRPFAGIAEVLGSNEREVLRQTNELKSQGVIRRISALINYRALGRTSTLVAAHIPQENLSEVAEVINSMQNVSHNYTRGHYYNLWFTLQAQTSGQIAAMLSELSARFGIDFHSLPVKRVFKLDVRFDAEGKNQLFQKVKKTCVDEFVELNENQKSMLSKLQNDLDVTAEPFDFLCSEDLKIKDVLRVIQELIDKGVIRRIASVVDHRKLGFVANVLFVSKIPQDRIVEAGERLGRFRMVSHCYERETFENWPYNLFAMMHSRSMGEIQQVADKFVEAEKIDSFELLPTAAELKKQPVRHCFD